MIVSQETFRKMQDEMWELAVAIRDRKLDDLEALEERAFGVMALSSSMAERFGYGPDRREDLVAIEVEWEVYGAEDGNERENDLFAASALREHSDQLLKEWGYDPDDPRVLDLLRQNSRR
jgi:hypothetical protein